MRTLESLALWAEKDLLTEQGRSDWGFLGYVRCTFDSGKVIRDDSAWQQTDAVASFELDELLYSLATAENGFVLHSAQDMFNFCRPRLHDHIPYSFNRECWGFRYLTDEYAWFIGCTPWNERCHFTVYCYVREKIFGTLAKERGLPESCHGVLRYTGERIRIRFGDSEFESFPQYGGNATENRRFASEQNSTKGLTTEQVAAMENGVVFGWESPYANVRNYDKDGHFAVSEEQERGGWRR